MNRRASLPGASELFRLTSSPSLDLPPAEISRPADASRSNGNGGNGGGNGTGTGNGNGSAGRRKEQLSEAGAVKRGSGRTRHDAKITVYVSGDELLALEHARLNLRGSHDLIVDRGRLVREAVAVLLADFDEHGEESVIVRRLRAGGVESGVETEEADG
ncbi:MAG: hypothetical protein QOI50_144 [Pseudonocardiales bacterium]|nr:hypothetical protein [Pseudonocardiales bacterium]